MHEEGFEHLRATNAGTTPDSVLRALAAGMQQIPAYFAKLCKINGATIDQRQADGNYPFPGTKTFGYVSIKQVPAFDPAATYPFVSSYVPIAARRRRRLFKVIEDNIARAQAAGHAVNAGASADHWVAPRRSRRRS